MHAQKKTPDTHAGRTVAAALAVAACLVCAPAPALADEGLAPETQTYDSAGEEWDGLLAGGAGNGGAVDLSYSVVADEAPAPEEEPPAEAASASGSPLPRTGDPAVTFALAATAAACAGAAGIVASADALRRKEGPR